MRSAARLPKLRSTGKTGLAAAPRLRGRRAGARSIQIRLVGLGAGARSRYCTIVGSYVFHNCAGWTTQIKGTFRDFAAGDCGSGAPGS